MDEIKSLSFHIMFYRLFRGVAKYIVYGNTFSSFGWLRSLHATTGCEGDTETGGDSVANLAILLLNLATFHTTLATIFSKST